MLHIDLGRQLTPSLAGVADEVSILDHRGVRIHREGRLARFLVRDKDPTADDDAGMKKINDVMQRNRV